MRSRKMAVNEAIRLFENHDGVCWHIGMVAIRQLLDFIYDDIPQNEQEAITREKIRQASLNRISYKLPKNKRKGDY